VLGPAAGKYGAEEKEQAGRRDHRPDDTKQQGRHAVWQRDDPLGCRLGVNEPGRLANGPDCRFQEGVEGQEDDKDGRDARCGCPRGVGFPVQNPVHINGPVAAEGARIPVVAVRRVLAFDD